MVTIPKKEDVKQCPPGKHVEYRKYRRRYKPYCIKDEVIDSKELMARCHVRGDGNKTVTGKKTMDKRIVNAMEQTPDWCEGEMGKVFCKANFDLPKDFMPSLKGDINTRGDDTRRFLDFLTERNVAIEEDFVEACKLKATQKDLYLSEIADKIETFKKSNYDLDEFAKNPPEVYYKGDKLTDEQVRTLITPIIISNDNYILDGHHRWAAILAIDFLDNEDEPVKMHVKRASIPMPDLLNRFVEFCSLEDVNCDNESKLPQLCLAMEQDERIGEDRMSETCKELIKEYLDSMTIT